MVITILAALAALWCWWQAWRTWRDPDSWHLDGASKQVVFHRWVEVAMYAVLGFACAIVAVVAILLM